MKMHLAPILYSFRSTDSTTRGILQCTQKKDKTFITNSVLVRSVEGLMVYQPKVRHSDYASCVLRRLVVVSP